MEYIFKFTDVDKICVQANKVRIRRSRTFLPETKALFSLPLVPGQVDQVTLHSSSHR
jgi:hypothetical protein